MALTGGRRMKTEEEIRERIRDLNFCIGIALAQDIHSLVAEYKFEIEILNWVLESEGNSD